jgi:hypothetical protein
MATVAENLQTALQSLSEKYAAAAAAAGPTYSIDGQSVDRTSYMESLLRQMTALKLQIALEGGPCEEETQGLV